MKVECVEGEKCLCCWYYVIDIGVNVEYFLVCGCCVENVVGSGEVCYFV